VGARALKGSLGLRDERKKNAVSSCEDKKAVVKPLSGTEKTPPGKWHTSKGKGRKKGGQCAFQEAMDRHLAAREKGKSWKSSHLREKGGILRGGGGGPVASEKNVGRKEPRTGGGTKMDDQGMPLRLRKIQTPNGDMCSANAKKRGS